MMNYDSSKTLTEQQLGATEPDQQIHPPVWDNPSELYEPFINQIVRKLKRNYDSIDALKSQLQGKTYKGDPAIDAVKTAYKASTGKDLPSESEQFATIQRPDPIKGPVDVPVDTPKETKQWPFSKGTDEDPYKYGTQGSGIAQVQQNLGLVQDGIWGPKTDAKIKELAPEFANGFTNQNLAQVIQKVRGYTEPVASAPPSIKRASVFNKPQNTAQLAGGTTKPRA